jgi:hypothetical protein
LFTNNRHINNVTRAALILVYVSFFSVQLNLHLGKTPVVSFFTVDFISQQSDKPAHPILAKDHHKESKARGFRLNKRFHPSHLFISPDIIQDLVKGSFSISTTLLNETQPLTSFSFNSPSLRGPPARVV